MTAKYTIQVTGKGILIRSAKNRRLEFTASEALMLLDILQNEEPTLRKIARESSPLPMTIQMNSSQDEG